MFSASAVLPAALWPARPLPGPALRPGVMSRSCSTGWPSEPAQRRSPPHGRRGRLTCPPDVAPGFLAWQKLFLILSPSSPSRVISGPGSPSPSVR